VRGDILKIQNLTTLLPFMEARYDMKTKFSMNIKSQNYNSKFKIVGNLPFYLTAPLIRKFLENKNKPELMVLLTQKEVAQRICAKPPKMNLLAVSVQFYAKPKIIAFVPRKSFWPRPKVDSAIIKIVPCNNNYTLDELFVRKFFTIVKAGFSHPRKQLVNNFSKILKLSKEKLGCWLLENDIKPTQRAETLSLEDWKKLAKSL
jgi:16S rRNA (adenine1518-N6/adenine1519-N6)-dimethyltransferase